MACVVSTLSWLYCGVFRDLCWHSLTGRSMHCLFVLDSVPSPACHWHAFWSQSQGHHCSEVGSASFAFDFLLALVFTKNTKIYLTISTNTLNIYMYLNFGNQWRKYTVLKNLQGYLIKH